MVINLRRRDGIQRRSDCRGARRYRCFLNGEDVSHRTFYVDVRRGVVRMFLCSPVTRQPFVSLQGHVFVEERRGRVKLIRRRVAADNVRPR